MTGSQLFQIKISPNVVTYETSEWNGRESDELHGYVQGEERVQEGWKITFTELEINFEKEEAVFAAAYAAIEAAKEKAYQIGIEVNYPGAVQREFADKHGLFTKVLSIKTVILSEEESQFELIPETFYAFIRVGMSVETTFARGCVLSAPIKENRSGLSVRGYAASMLSDELDDVEFCEYIFNLNK